jgi:hypothetical protein
VWQNLILVLLLVTFNFSVAKLVVIIFSDIIIIVE